MILAELLNLEDDHPQQRIEQQRQHGDRKERAAIPELVFQLAKENQFDVGPGQGEGSGFRVQESDRMINDQVPMTNEAVNPLVIGAWSLVIQFMLLHVALHAARSIEKTIPPGLVRRAAAAAPPAFLRTGCARGA